ncbi:putative carbonic anhydrase 3 [Pollicipes pollicipes]|uniref:putative carbonic anhydrase 3 n=1 Tax=Pollicipes pollicipes TaxID=41117 RepID=UPI001884AF73|nr:putative carbonic anhydrase 3 [Pollicipes pollicipes]
MAPIASPLAGLLIAAAASTVQAGDEWTYYGQAGPDHWPTMGFSQCSGERQSPINVVTNRVIPTTFKPITFHHFDQIPLSLNFSNNHHSATAKMSWERLPMIQDGGLPGRYEVVNFHFHWGEDDFKGSEHTIDGESYPLEMHVVCKNTKYKELSDALLHSDGLAVLGVMYELSETNNRALRSLEPALRGITAGGATVEVADPPRLLELMPWNTFHFYRYDGSLTTPGCQEAVTWTIFLQPLKVTARQVELFRALRGGPAPIGFNYRPLQRRYNRAVFLSAPAAVPRSVWRGQTTVEQTGSSGRPLAGSTTLPLPLSLLMLMLLVLKLRLADC